MNVGLLAIGMLVAVAIWIYQRRAMSLATRLWIVAGMAAFGAVVYFLLLLPVGGVFLGGEHWYDVSPWREILFLVLMLTGMAARYFAGAIEERRELIRQRRANGEAHPNVPLRFDPWEFSYPLLVSVVTFGGLLGQINDDGVNLTNVILCFQTGFFWQTILKKQIGDIGRA